MPPPSENAPGFYRFSNPDKLRGALSAAGFPSVEIRDVRGEIRFDSPPMYWEFMTDVVAPIVKALQETTAGKRKEVEEAVLAEAEKRMGGDGLVLPWKAWVGTAAK